MTAETIHTCSYSCERPECIRAQRDELAARLTAAQQQPAEIEALRAEVEEWKAAAKCASEQQDSLFREARALNELADNLRAEVYFRDSVIATHAADTREYQKRISQAEARAERLAELLDRAYGYVPAGTLADQIHCALLRYQEEGNEQ